MSQLVDLGGDWSLWPVAPLRGAGMPFDWLGGLAGDLDAGQAALRTLIREPSFLAALAWQNPGVAGWVGRDRSTLTSYRAGVLARYAQRYCAKNDSIGFFGPVGWAAVAQGAGDRLAVSGTAQVRRTEVCLEQWSLLALARMWAADSRIRPHLPVRRNPAVHDDGEHLHRPYRTPVAVDPVARRVLDLVDGRRTVAEVAAADPEAFDRLERAGVLMAGWRIPPSAHPEAVLRSQLTDVADTVVRGELLAALDLLDRALAEVAKAEGPAALNAALAELDRTFSALTATPASRTKHDAAAGRTVAYLDCRRDLDVEVPAGLVDRLAAPLQLLLRSARWLTAQAAEAVEEELDRRYAALARKRDVVRLCDLYLAAADVLSGAPGTPIHDVADDFRLRWAEVLGTADGRLSAADLEPAVRTLFPAAEPGWAAARQHSPDLMLSDGAAGPSWVLGELHLAMNTLESRFFHTLADDPRALVDLTARDMAGGRVVPCYPHGPRIDSRRYPPLAVHVPDRYLYWSHSDDMGAPAGARVWPATALLVRRAATGLVAGPAGDWHLPVREFFGEFLTALVVNRFRLPAPGPRITVDDLVIRRASWHFGQDEMPDGVIGGRGYRPERLAGWLGAAGVPRHLFARIAGEPKPFYVDLDSALLVTNLARAWRRAATGPVELEEMLPGPEDLWLRDARGHRYTTEFRMVAVDRVGRQLPGLSRSDA